jgi:transcription initiation factor TFIIIB Brf1 subunit/transcription initiation factor TFIIB
MSWDDIDDILFDGTPEQIENVKCPECGGELKLSYFPQTRNMEILCSVCGTIVRVGGVAYEPNFAKFARERVAA